MKFEKVSKAEAARIKALPTRRSPRLLRSEAAIALSNGDTIRFEGTASAVNHVRQTLKTRGLRLCTRSVLVNGNGRLTYAWAEPIA